MSLRSRFLPPLDRKFARLATNLVLRRPGLWRLLRGPMKRQFHRLAPVWDSFRDPGHLAAYEAALEHVEPPPRRALDLGTGTGAGAVAIARRFPEAEVVGLDLARGMLEEARRKLPPELGDRVRFQQGDAAALPFPDASVGLVGLANMIPFFDELARVVEPGGSVVFGFSSGPETPIYVAPEVLRAELGSRGFTDFADLSSGRGTALVAHKRDAV